MDLTKLETFLAVAQTGSFHLAAELLFTTPSTVSKHIAYLEKAYGVSLFRRSVRGAELTRQGALFLPYAERILEEQRSLRSTLAADSRQAIRLCAIPPQHMLPDFALLTRFEQLYPQFPISVIEEHGSRISRALTDGRYDLGLCADAYLDQSLLEWLPLREYRVMVLVPRCHPLAGRACISLSEMSGEGFVSLPEHTGVPSYHRALCRQAGIEYRVACYTEREENLVAQVAKGSGAALVSDAYLGGNLLFRTGTGSPVLLTLSEDFRWHLSLVRPRHFPLSPPAAALWRYMREQISSRAAAPTPVCAPL